MGTRLNIPELREYLIDIYERIVSGEDVRAEARKVFKDYRGASRFISETMQEALGYLEDIGWNISPEISHLSNPFQEITSEILTSLKDEEKNPPKEWFKKVYKKERKRIKNVRSSEFSKDEARIN